MSEPSGRTKRQASFAKDETQDEENGRAESWQAGPSNKNLSMPEYTRRIHKRTDCRTASHEMAQRVTTRPCAVLPYSRLSESLYTTSFVHCSKQCSLFKEIVYREFEREEVAL
jgi:hypothetical protein